MKTPLFAAAGLLALALSACGSNDAAPKASSATPAPATTAQNDASMTAQDDAIDADGLALTKQKKPGPLWRCVAVGVNFYDGMRYSGDGPTQTAANNAAVSSCQAAHAKGKCAVFRSPFPGIVSLGGCARLR